MKKQVKRLNIPVEQALFDELANYRKLRGNPSISAITRELLRKFIEREVSKGVTSAPSSKD